MKHRAPERGATTGWSLRDLLLGGGSAVPEPRRATGDGPPSGTDERLEAALARQDLGIRRALPGLTAAGLETAVAEVARAVSELVDIDLVDQVVAGWRLHRALVDAAQETWQNPRQIRVLELDSHTMTSGWDPHVDVVVNGTAVCRIRVRIELEVTVHGLLAVIRTGRLVELRAGRCELTGRLSVGGEPVAERSTEIDLPGSLLFRRPWPLIPAAA